MISSRCFATAPRYAKERTHYAGMLSPGYLAAA